MTNLNYRRGAARERYQKKKLEKQGWIVLRSAGSHGFADLIAIGRENKLIRFIQCKPRKFSQKEKQRLEEVYSWLSGGFRCRFEVI